MGDMRGWGPLVEPFRSDPGYLSLLHLGPGSAVVVRRIVQLVRTPACVTDSHVRALLAERNWRPHLVGIIAVLASPKPELFVADLWGALDNGSWVSPQLAVALFHLDAAFAAEAKRRVSSGSPTQPRAYRGGFWFFPSRVFQHTETGPASPRERSAKATAALLQQLEAMPLEREWARAARIQPDIAATLALDRDSSGMLASMWDVGLREAVRGLEIPLREPVNHGAGRST
jgi:hypothetical protein